MSEQQSDERLWREVTVRLKGELATLSKEDTGWIENRIRDVSRIQEELHALFLDGEGAALCRECGGGCCGRGKHHMTLVNLLSFYFSEGEFPTPDFDQTCPLLTSSGCRLSPAHRPFNCVTFICEEIENRLDSDQLMTFYALEKSLRSLYEAFDRRFAASSMRGIMIRCERLGEGLFLVPPDIAEKSIKES